MNINAAPLLRPHPERTDMSFEINDLVSLADVPGWHQVVGVIQEERRLFVALEPTKSEASFAFDDVVEQYRQIAE
jgi:hypothetical protein